MNDQSGTAQLRFLEETAIRLRQNGFTVEPIEDHHLPSAGKKAPLPRFRQGQRAVPAGVCRQRPGAGCAANRDRHRQNDYGIHGDSGNRHASQSRRSHRRLPRPCGLQQRGAGGPPHRTRRPIRDLGVGLRPQRRSITDIISRMTMKPPSATSPCAATCSKRRPF